MKYRGNKEVNEDIEDEPELEKIEEEPLTISK
jgi:hypothetical protein